MKKKTVITTEKREIWIVRETGEKSPGKNETAGTSEAGSELLVPFGEDPKPSTEKGTDTPDK